MTGSRITGLGASLPPRELTSDELERSLGLEPGWIAGRTGIESRRIAGPADTTATLATAAARGALDDAGIAPEDVGYVIVATSTSDFALPATASLVQAALGCGGGAYDLNAACSGFLVALAQADALIRSGAARHVLVTGVDVLSRITDFSDPKTGILFGDGAGAAVVSACDVPALGSFVLHADGRPELLYAERGGTVVMEGREVYRRAVQEMTAVVAESLAGAGVALDEVDLVVAHQANARILTAVAERLGISETKMFTNVGRCGNTSAASIPLALADASASGHLRDGDLVVLTAFGAGFAWGAGIARWSAPAGSGTRRLERTTANA